MRIKLVFATTEFGQWSVYFQGDKYVLYSDMLKIPLLLPKDPTIKCLDGRMKFYQRMYNSYYK